MRHRVAHRKLGRVTEHRLAMLRNLSTALLQHEHIETTVPRAKELRPFVEQLITAARRGVDLGKLRARQVEIEDFERFDLILAMDRENLQVLESACPPDQRHKLELLMRYAGSFDTDEVPDPYFGGEDGFDRVLDMVEDAAQGLVEALRQR